MSLLSLLPVSTVLFALVFRPSRSSRDAKRYLIALWFVITLILGLREAHIELKGDLNNYYRMYAVLRDTSWHDIFTTYVSMESGYKILNKILSSIVSWNQFIIIFEAAFVTGCAFYFIYKNTKDVFIGTLTYMSVISMLFAMTGFRQAFAISFILISVEQIKKQKFIPFIVLVLLATTMHSSALIFVPAYILGRLRFSRKHVGGFLFAYFVAVFFIEKLLSLGNSLVGGDYEVTGKMGNTFGGVIIIAFLVFSLILSYKNANSGKDRVIYYLTLVAVLVYTMQFQIHSFERAAFYFMPANAPLIANGIRENKIFNAKSNRLLYYFVVIFLIFYFYHSFSQTISTVTFII